MESLGLEDVRERLDQAEQVEDINQVDVVETEDADILNEVLMASPDTVVGLGSKEGDPSIYHAFLVDKNGHRGNWFVTEWTPARKADPRAVDELGFGLRFTEDYLVASFIYEGTDAEILDIEDDPYETQGERIEANVRAMGMDLESYHLNSIEPEGYLVGEEIPAGLQEEYRNARDAAEKLVEVQST